MNAKVPKKSLLSTYFYNIDGNASNFDAFVTELHQIENKFSILGLAETNCNPNNKDLYSISGYTSFYQNVLQINGQNKKKGTGVVLYVHDSLNTVLLPEKSVVNADIETLFISITNLPKPVTIGVIYRPPNGSINSFINQFRIVMQSLTEETSYVMGDFNINLINRPIMVSMNIKKLFSVQTFHLLYLLLYIKNRDVKIPVSIIYTQTITRMFCYQGLFLKVIHII